MSDATVGETFDDGILEYAVLTDDGESGTVSVVRILDKTAAVDLTILPACVHGGKTYLVTEIAPGAFRDSAITGISIGENVVSIGANAFRGCASLTGELTFPEGLAEIGDNAFMGCIGITGHVAIPSGVERLNAFDGCMGIDSVALPEGLEYVSGFRNCVGLTSIEFPGSVTAIGNNAFSGCSNLAYAALPASLEDIGSMAFYNTALAGDLVIPDGVETIGVMAFRNCADVENLTIGAGVKSIGDFAFSGLAGLKTMLFLPTSFGAVDMAGDCLSFRNAASGPVLVVSMAGNEFPAGCHNAFTVFDFGCSLVTASTSIEGSGEIVGGGIFKNGGTATFEVLPAPGYSFVQWADGVTTNPRNFTVSATKEYIAKTAIREYTLVYNTPNGANGDNPSSWNVTMAGDLADAIPNDGYAFAGWFADKELTIAVSAITLDLFGEDNVFVFYADIAPESYALNLVEGVFTNLSVVSGSEDGRVTYKTDLVFNAAPIDGYMEVFEVHVLIGGTPVPQDEISVSDYVYTLPGNLILDTVEVRSQAIASNYAVTYGEGVVVLEGSTPVPNGSMVGIGAVLSVHAVPVNGYVSEVAVNSGVIMPDGTYVMGHSPAAFSAVHTPINYDVTYVVANGSGGDNPAQWNVEMGPEILPASMEPGYVFDGWFANERYTEAFRGFTLDMFAGGGVTVYGKSSVASYDFNVTQGQHTTFTVISGANGSKATFGTDLTFSVTYDAYYASGVTVTVTIGDVSKAASPDSSGTVYAVPGEDITDDVGISTEIVPKKFRVAYDSAAAKVTKAGGTVANGALVEVGASLIVTPLERVAYGATLYAGPDVMVPGEYVMEGDDVTFDVVYAPIQYAVSYMVSNGSKGDNPDEWNVEMDAGLNPAEMAAGNMFLGWYMDAARTERFEGFSPDIMVGGGVTVYAKTAPCEYGLVLSGDENARVTLVSGGNGGIATHGIDVVFDVDPDPQFAKTYRTVVTVGGERVKDSVTRDGDRYTLAGGAIVGDVAIHVSTYIPLYSVTFDENLTVTVDGVELTSGNKVQCGTVVTVVAAERPYYNVAVIATVGEVSADGKHTVEASVVFSARYTPIEYTVTYVVGPGAEAIPQGTYTVESVPARPNAYKVGHVFDGWFLDPDFTMPVGNPAPGDMTGNLTFYAKFTILSYVVTWEWIGEGGVPMSATQKLVYGTMPARDSPGDYYDSDGIKYRFEGWSPTLELVSGDVTYVAQYEAIPPEPFASAKGSGPGAGVYAAVILTILGIVAVSVYLLFIRKS